MENFGVWDWACGKKDMSQARLKEARLVILEPLRNV